MRSNKEINKQAISGVKWSTFSSIIRSVFQLLQIVILSRFLTKYDFGLYALMQFVILFVNIFATMGFNIAIINKKKISTEEFSSVVWLNLFLSLIIYTLLFFSAPLYSSFYGKEELISMIQIAGLSIIFLSLGRPFYVYFQKELNFKIVSVGEIIGVTTSLLLSVILVMAGFGVYSLVYAVLLSNIIMNMFFIVLGVKYFSVKFFLSVKLIAPMIKMGSYQLGAVILDFFSNNIEILIIGKFFPTQQLGLYSLAKQIPQRIQPLLNRSLVQVVTPYLAKFQDYKDDLNRKFLKATKLIAFVNFPVLFFISVVSAQIIIVFYGINYKGAVALLQIVSIAFAFRVIGVAVSGLVAATGKTHLSFTWTIIRITLSAAALFIASRFSILAVVWTQLGLAALFIPLFWRIQIFRLSKINLLLYLRSFMPIAFASFISYIITIWLMSFIDEPPIFHITISLLIFGSVYFLMLLILEQDFKKITNKILIYIQEKI